MFSRPPDFWQSLKLRPKLVLSFAALAGLAGLCGTIGLLFVDRVSSAASMFSDVTAPMLTESIALVENGQRMRSLFFRGLALHESLDEVSHKLSEVHIENRQHLDMLRRLSSGAQLGIEVAEVERLENEFVRTLDQMLAANKREQDLAQIIARRSADLESRKMSIQSQLRQIAHQAEGAIAKGDDEAKVQVQTGTATIDNLRGLVSDVVTELLPALQSAHRLGTEVELLERAVKIPAALKDSQHLVAVESGIRAAFKNFASLLRRLAGRLRDPDGKRRIASLRVEFDGLEATVLGSDGLLSMLHRLAAARTDLTNGRQRLDEIERAYLQPLEQVRYHAGQLNEAARGQSVEATVQGRAMVGGSILMTVFFSLAFGLVLSRRLTAPLMRLTAHAVAIRETGELKQLADITSRQRRDEIGILGQSLNAMIAELAEARRALVASSEAKIRKQYERLQTAIDNMPQGLCMFDSERRLIVCNRRYAELYQLGPELTAAGTPLQAILAHRVANNVAGPDIGNYAKERLAAAAENRPWYLVQHLRDGKVVAISHHPMPDGGSISMHEDITERRNAEARIAHMAHFDALTDLPNRMSFRASLEQRLSELKDGQIVCVLCLDLDQFKSVNDTLGHPIGDCLLQAVADRIRSLTASDDVAARLGGDEFAIVQALANLPVTASDLAERLIDAISHPYEINGHQVVIGASIGIAVAPNDGRDPDALLKNADMALYRAKEDGRGTYRFFEPEMDARMQARRTLELDLRKAVVLREFELFYQPIVIAETGDVCEFEALVRWHHPQRGLVPPAEFIPLAEEIGLINGIGAWVLKTACAEAMSWPSHIKVAVNLSPAQFHSGTLVLDVIAALGNSGLPARRLELEITETVLLHNTDATLALLKELRNLGVRISMDDFGTGYSSLGYLRQFPFDKIKIDRSFVRELPEKADSLAIIRAVAGLGRTLGISTTAEGVETREQLDQLRKEGCTEVQGYLFSRPCPSARIPALLRSLSAATAAARV